MNKDVLYLASASRPRQELLIEADINFKVINHKADESVVDYQDNFESYVLDIAKEKMNNLELTESVSRQEIFVLTADTLVCTANTNIILGKPKDILDAKRMLDLMRKEKVKISTGCCLEKKVLHQGLWQDKAKKHWVTSSMVEFIVKEEELEKYFKKFPQALKSAGSGIIEGYGQRFCKSINGSYSNIIGIPIYELTQGLHGMAFNF